MLRWRVWNLPLLKGHFYSFHVLRLRRGPPRAGVHSRRRRPPARDHEVRASLPAGDRGDAPERLGPGASARARRPLGRAIHTRLRANRGTRGFRRRAARQGGRRRLLPRSRRPPRAYSPSTRGFPASRGVDASEPRSRAPRGPAFMRLQTPFLLFASTHPAPPPSSRRSSCATRRSRNA